MTDGRFTPIVFRNGAAHELRWRSAAMLLHAGLSEIAAKAFVDAVVEAARKIPGDAAFGDQTALAYLADFLLAANDAEIDGETIER